MQKGDVVTLKSGGEPMTITLVHPEGSEFFGQVAVAWFNGRELIRAAFSVEELKAYR